METAVTPRRLATVQETLKAYPAAFKTDASLRWQVFSNPEFVRACVRRIGARVLLDLDAFERWLDMQGSQS